VDESAEQVVTSDGGCCAGVVVVCGAAAVWRSEPERTVRPVPVVVLCVHAQDTFEMSASEDEDAIQAVAADRAHPALGVGVRVRGLHGCPDHLDPLGTEDLVESTAELPVAVMDQQPERQLNARRAA
jgi:hypothetical protein